jgi:hypothetical protein
MGVERVRSPAFASEWASDAELEQREQEWAEAVLRGALDRIRFGWHQGSLFGDGTGHYATAGDQVLAYCLLGAVEAAAADLRLDVVVAARAKRLLAQALGKDGRNDNAVVQFNDAASRSKLEVIELLATLIPERSPDAPSAPRSLHHQMASSESG